VSEPRAAAAGAESRSNTRIASTTGSIVTHSAASPWLVLPLYAVSYTHLDVYKRQHEHRVCRWAIAGFRSFKHGPYA